MQKLKVKNLEILKINGERFAVTCSDAGVFLKKIGGKEEESLCRELLDGTYTKELGIYIPEGIKVDENGCSYFESYDMESCTDKKLYLKYFRLINDPTLYGLDENKKYLLYFNWKDNIIYLFEKLNNHLKEIKDFKDKLLDGEVIR